MATTRRMQRKTTKFRSRICWTYQTIVSALPVLSTFNVLLKKQGKNHRKIRYASLKNDRALAEARVWSYAFNYAFARVQLIARIILFLSSFATIIETLCTVLIFIVQTKRLSCLSRDVDYRAFFFFLFLFLRLSRKLLNDSDR